MGGCFSKDADNAEQAVKGTSSTADGKDGYYVTDEKMAKIWEELETIAAKWPTTEIPKTATEEFFGNDVKSAAMVKNPYTVDKENADKDVDTYTKDKEEIQKLLDLRCTKIASNKEMTKTPRVTETVLVGKVLSSMATTTVEDFDIISKVDRGFSVDSTNWMADLKNSRMCSKFLIDPQLWTNSAGGVVGHVSIFIILKKIIMYGAYFGKQKSSLYGSIIRDNSTDGPEPVNAALPDSIQKQINIELECEELEVAIEEKMNELGVTFSSLVQEICTKPIEAIEPKVVDGDKPTTPRTVVPKQLESHLREWYFEDPAFREYFSKSSEMVYYFRCISMSIGLQCLVEQMLLSQIEGSTVVMYQFVLGKVSEILKKLLSKISSNPDIQALAKNGIIEKGYFVSVAGPIAIETKDLTAGRTSLNNPDKKGLDLYKNIYMESEVMAMRNELLDMVRNVVTPVRRSLQTCLILTKVKTATIRAILSTLDDVKVVDTIIRADIKKAYEEEKGKDKDPSKQPPKNTDELQTKHTLFLVLCNIIGNEIRSLCQTVYKEYKKKKQLLDELSSSLTLLRSHSLEIIGYYKAIDLIRISEIRECMNSIQRDTRIFRIETKNLLVDLVQEIETYLKYLLVELGEEKYDPAKPEPKLLKDPRNLTVLKPLSNLKDQFLVKLINSIDVTDFGKSQTQAVEKFRLSYAINAICLARHDLEYLKLNMVGLFQARFNDAGIHDIWKCRYKDPGAIEEAVKFITDKQTLLGLNKEGAESKPVNNSRRVTINSAKDLKEKTDLEPFKHEPALSAAAMRHSRFMAENSTLSHKFEGKDTIAAMLGSYCMQLAGDVGVCVGQFKHLEIYRIVLELILEDGLSVKNNREYVLSSKFKKVGFGFAKSEGDTPESAQFYVTFIFAEDAVTKEADKFIKLVDTEEPPSSKESTLKYSDIFLNDSVIDINKFGTKATTAAATAKPNAPAAADKGPQSQSGSSGNQAAGGTTMVNPPNPATATTVPQSHAKGAPAANLPQQAGNASKVTPVGS